MRIKGDGVLQSAIEMSDHSGHVVRERIVACRKRLRRRRAMQKSPTGDGQTTADATLVRTFDKRRAAQDAETVSADAETSMCWTKQEAGVGG